MEDGFDFLTFGYDSESSIRSAILAKVTGVTKLRTLTANSSKMWIEMTSDDFVSLKGFELQIKQTSNDSSEL